MKYHSTFWICDCCMLHLANGECGDCHYEEGHDREPLEAIPGGLTVFLGDESEPYSTSQCWTCDTYLHGIRHKASAYED